MFDRPLYKGKMAAKLYAEAGDNILPGFPLCRLDHVLDGALTDAGVNAWRNAPDELYEEACLDTEEDGSPWLEPVMNKNPNSLRLYFEYAHANPGFSFDMQNNEVMLSFPVYARPGDYVALSLPVEEVGMMLAENLDELDRVCDILRDDPELAEYDGAPRALVQAMYETARDAETFFYESTGWRPEAVTVAKKSAQWLTGDLTPGLAIGAQSGLSERRATAEEIKDLGKAKKTALTFPKSDLNPN